MTSDKIWFIITTENTKEVFILNREIYKNLMKIDFHEVESYIINSIRDEYQQDPELLSYIVALPVLSLILKETQNFETLVKYIDNNFEEGMVHFFLKKTAEKFFSLIEELAEKYSKDILKATALFSEPRLFSDISQISTPIGISKLTIKLLDLKEDDIILDLGSGVNSFLTATALRGKGKYLYGVEINRHNVIIANMRKYLLEQPINFIQGNFVSQDYSYLKANKVFSNFPLGLRLRDLKDLMNKNNRLEMFFKKARKTVSGDWIYSMAAYLNMNKPGKTIVLMSGAGTWNKPDEEIRQKLLENGIIEGVILLPPNLMTSTAIQLSMIILSQDNKKVRMVDASKIYTEGRRINTLEDKDIEKIIEAYNNDTDISIEISAEELAKQDYILNPQRYIGFGNEIEEGIPLGDVIRSINRGAMINSKELDDMSSKEKTNCYYLRLQNINDGIIDSELPCLVYIDEKYLKYCIKDKNLIISKLFPYKIAMARVRDDEYILASGNLYFIELDETKVNPVFVEAFLQSEAGLSQLNRLSKGTVMKSISIQDLKNIRIPDLPREQQDKIAEEYSNLNDLLIVLKEQIDLSLDKKARLFEGMI